MAIDKNPDANRDPITGAPGSHPVGTGLGAAAGGMAAGAAAGTVAGPIGTMAGAAVGAVVGGLMGKAAGEALDPTVEDEYWRSNYTKEPYYQSGTTFDDYAPAYRTGYQGRAQYRDRDFTDVESDLEASYNRAKGNSKLKWEQAKSATRAAWDRVSNPRR
jgi:phage tail tape-measure protein